jgi:2',3'-cyclic-nucleotide 2'-phosphodiesterase (5'-nucleotidase family)
MRLFLSIIILCFIVSCAGIKPVPKQGPPASRQSLAILFSNSTLGAFEPQGCGCRRQGGVARRTHFINNFRKNNPSAVVLDTGNSLFDRSDLQNPGDTTKADYMLAVLNHMGVDVLNMGVYDLSNGINYIKAKEKKLLFPLVSANITSLSTQDLIFRPHVIKTVNRIKIGIFGITRPYDNILNLPISNEIHFDSPFTSADRTVKELQNKGCALIVLLSQLSQEDNKRIAQEVPGIHFILGSSSKQLLPDPEVVGRTAILSPGAGGTHMGVLQITGENGPAPFYHAENRASVIKKISALKQKEQNPENVADIEEVVLKRVLLEKKLKSFDGKNSYSYKVIALDQKIAEDPHVRLLVEKHKEAKLRKKLSSYKHSVPLVDISTLAEEKRLMALRLMNEVACDENRSIAELAGTSPFCRKLAQMIVDSIRKGQSEGKIRYSILYEKGKNSLDKNLQFQ